MNTIVRQEEIQFSEAEMILEKPMEISVIELRTVKEKRSRFLFFKKTVEVDRSIKHTFTVRPLKISQQQRIIARLAMLDESPFHNNDNVMSAYFKLAANNMEDVVYCAGVLLTDSRRDPDEHLLQFIRDNFDNNDLESLWAVMAKQLYTRPFLNGIILIKGIDLSKVNPSA